MAMVDRRVALAIIAGLCCLAGFAAGVDRNNFKTCDQSSFCRRLRSLEPQTSEFVALPQSLQQFKQFITLTVVHQRTQHEYTLKLACLKGGGTFHFQVDEKQPLSVRYRVQDVLVQEPQYGQTRVESSSETAVSVACGEGDAKATVQLAPLKVDFYQQGKLVVSANAKGMMRFEHLRTKQQPQHNDEPAADQEQPEGQASEAGEDAPPAPAPAEDPGAWEENFKSHHDSKPKGPEGLALDFTFPEAKVLFGIPEHADTFALRHTATKGTDPYRLYNLDVFEYELNNGMALYGSVPVLYGHGETTTAGVFWLNAAETWVDIFSANRESNVVSSLVNLVSWNSQTEPPAANFISESGIMDVFVLLGPAPTDAFRQYTDLTGHGPLPQLYAMAYHQCRWNYNDERDVEMVSAKFDEHDIPMDTMWLDIEYTDGKRYFTWDHHKFSHPVEMIRNLTDLGRHLTIIIDPHIKRDGGYFFHNECTERGLYVKNKDGNDYEGWCWPGAASYVDFFSPDARKHYADQYLLENFREQSATVGIWNDMNEPSVFNGPEVTMLKDNLHHGGLEHRDVHNLYGHMQLVATFDGLQRRGEGTLRPFILTRSHFAGSQRYAAVWTGDNMAEWGHLQASIKMCLSLAVAGISFCGADVGGFFGNPDGELFARWYQTGAFQPFFRSHAHIDTKRREPWLFPEDVKLVIRDAIRKRYRLLPFWYTLFYEHERSGLPIMRPLLAHYPTDVNAFAIDNQFLLGDQLLVAPVLESKQARREVYFPARPDGTGDWWYDCDTHRRHSAVGLEPIPVDSYKVPVFQRGGTIVPRKERVRRASTLMRHDPYTLTVALDRNGQAKGTLYIDDETSYEYRRGHYLYLQLEYRDGVLSSRKIDSTASYPTKSWLERVVLVGLPQEPKAATLYTDASGAASGQLELERTQDAVIVRKPDVSMTEAWSIKFAF
ncbi:AGAP000862-PA-like protein [Anopheles sinensis]|uniref:Glucosidase II subunit alpha n=1 Tax=Anopheles sinensis TaxID=74873 RepID=A0A084WFF5_ANOSI|nr:AGAP000862-PA-like protein [Anopheles sinensis]